MGHRFSRRQPSGRCSRSALCRNYNTRALSWLILIQILVGATATRSQVLPINTLTFDPNVVGNNDSTTATFSLFQIHPDDYTLVLGSSDPSVVEIIPSTLIIPAGTLAATFSVTTHNVVLPERVTINACDLFGGCLPADLIVYPLSAYTLTATPSAVEQGQCSTGTITLAESSPVGGTHFKLARTCRLILAQGHLSTRR